MAMEIISDRNVFNSQRLMFHLLRESYHF